MVQNPTKSFTSCLLHQREVILYYYYSQFNTAALVIKAFDRGINGRVRNRIYISLQDMAYVVLSLRYYSQPKC